MPSLIWSRSCWSASCRSNRSLDLEGGSSPLRRRAAAGQTSAAAWTHGTAVFVEPSRWGQVAPLYKLGGRILRTAREQGSRTILTQALNLAREINNLDSAKGFENLWVEGPSGAAGHADNGRSRDWNGAHGRGARCRSGQMLPTLPVVVVDVMVGAVQPRGQCPRQGVVPDPDAPRMWTRQDTSASARAARARYPRDGPTGGRRG
jgi:hypothetical protein